MVRVSNRSGERSLKVLIMDFGIAKVLSDQDTGHSLTEVIGTVKYASPEQIRRGKDIIPARTSTRSAWCSTSFMRVGTCSRA